MDRDQAVDAAVKQLDADLVVVEATKEEGRRAQLRARAEQEYLNRVTGP